MKGKLMMKPFTFMTSFLCLLAALLFFAGTAFSAGETVHINIGTLPPGKSVTVTYDVTVNKGLPTSQNSVSQQGTVSGSNFTNVTSDDPDTPTAGDATVTPVVSIVPVAGFGSALQFDGSDDYMQVPDGGTLNSSAYTIEVWVRLATVRASSIIFRTDEASSAYSNAIYINADGKFVHYASDGSARTVTGTTTAIAGRWYHVAGVVDGSGMMRLYVNGIEEGTAVSGMGVLWSGGNRYLVGHELAAAGLNNLDGRLDELRIWNAGLSADQIGAWMYRGVDVSHGSYANLVAGYRFDESGGATAMDSAGSFNATLYNMAANPHVPSTVGELYTSEDTPASGRFVLNGPDGTSTDGLNLAANISFVVDSATLGTVSGISGNTFTFTPTADANGNADITYRIYDGTSYSAPYTTTVHIAPVADTPSVSAALTNVNQQTSSGLVISRNTADGPEVTHFKITGISGGTLYQHDGTTRIDNGAFITFDQGNAGLKFTPANGSNATGGFTVQSSLSDSDAGLGGGTASGVITVNSPPVFVGSVTTVTVLRNSGATDIKGLLHVDDIDVGQSLTWSVQAAPDHGGSLTISGAGASSGSADITPGGTITYQPAAGYTGTETFTVRVSDTIAAATRTITATVLTPSPTATEATSIGSTGFTANWGAVTSADGYYLDVATDNGFTNILANYNNKDVGSVTGYPVAGLSPGTTYFYRVRSYGAGWSSESSNTIQQSTLTGSVTAIIPDPVDPAKLYAAVDGGGVFLSSNGGASWTPAGPQPANRRVKGLAIHPTTTTTLFAATYGNGIYTSTDSGATWSACTGQPANLNAISLAIDSTGNLYAGTEGGIFSSSNCGTWTNTGLAVDPTKPPVSIISDMATPATLYAGLDGDGVYTGTAGSSSWKVANGSAPNNLTNLHVKVLALSSGTLYAATYGGGVFKTGDGGDTWSACAGQPDNQNVLSLKIDGSGKLYASTEAGVFVSANGCTTWTAMNSGLP